MEVIAWVLFVAVIELGIFALWPRRMPHEIESPEVRARQHEQLQHDLMEAQSEIVRLDFKIAEIEADRQRLKVQVAEYTVDNAELTQSVEHLVERLRTSEKIRQKLAESLSGRCCGKKITMGNADAHVVHGAVVVSDPDIRGGFLDICNSYRPDPDADCKRNV